MELAYGLLFALALAWVDLLVAVTAITVTAALVAAPLLVHYHAAADGQPIAFFGYAVSSVREAVVVTVAGVLLMPVVAYLLTAFAAARAALTRTILAWRGREELDAKVLELSRSRARILQASDAQRRRIERDLHDGAQQRLTGLIMTLGLARLELADAPPEARSLVDKAHEESKRVLAELRDLVHGIHPQVLTDRGLAPALAGLVERCPVPVELAVDLPERPPEPVEAAAWFIVSEALANVAKHSGARRAWVLARRVGQLLVLEVRDDGVGGADPARGGGLVGLADRVSVLDGRMQLVSPPGGPTVLRVELPCGW
jgi:signal transduction histidine kinase